MAGLYEFCYTRLPVAFQLPCEQTETARGEPHGESKSKDLYTEAGVLGK